MSHATLKLAPGVNKNRTPALNEAAFSDTQLVRFVPDREGLGLVQKMGGWKKFYGSQFHTVIRALWAWEDTNGNSHLAVGSETATVEVTSGFSNGAQAFMSYEGPNIFATSARIVCRGFVPDGYNGTFVVRRSVPGQVVFDCPETDEIITCGTISTGSSLSVITNKTRNFITPGIINSQIRPNVSTSAGSPIVTIADDTAILYENDVVFIKTQISVGGIILFGSYVIQNVRSGGRYDIISRDVLGNPNPATETVTNGGALPVFEFSFFSPYVTVALPNHGYSEGDTFPILDPVEVGDTRLYGNYIVSLRNVSDRKNNFQILNTGKVGVNTLYAYPTKTSSDGSKVSVTLQREVGLAAADKISWSGLSPNYDGVFTVANSNNQNLTIDDGRNWNQMVSLGRFFKSTGAVGGKFDICYSDPYVIHAGDTVILSGFTPSAYDGEYVVETSSDNRATVVTKATGDIVTPGSVTVRKSTLNYGKAYFVYNRSSDSQPVIAGYGVGGYGDGGYGVGKIPQVAIPQQEPVPVVGLDWTLDNWGDVLIACPVGGAIYQWNPLSNASTASIIPSAPPVNDGVFVAMPQRQIVAWGSTFSGIQDPLLIRWCDVANFNNWSATATNQAGSYRIAKGSRVVSCLQGPQQGIVWTDLGVWSMQYVGLPIVYSFTEIGTGCGLIGRKAAGSLNGVVYWMGQSQFFALGGSGATPIPCPVWDVAFQNLDPEFVNNIRFAGNSNFGEIMWFFPTKGSSGVITDYVKFNVLLNAWDYGKLGRSAWINQSVFGPPIGAGTDGYIYQHEIGNDADTLPMISSFQTGYFQIGEGEYKIFVDQVWPDFKYGTYDGPPSADLKLTFYVTNYPGDEPRAYGPFDMNVFKKFLTPRFRGRLVSIKVESSDGASFWRIGAMRYRATPDGKFG